MAQSTQLFQQIRESLKKASAILIVSHEDPDPDAIGSSLALRQAFKHLGLKSECYLPAPLPFRLNFLPDFFEIKSAVNFSDYDLFFCLDYGDFRRLPVPDSLPPEKIITIDHHLGDQRGEIKIIDPEASSTAEIVYNLLKENEIEINKNIAVSLLTGIAFDTGLFFHPSTSPKTIKAAADLLSKGAPFAKIIRSGLNPNFSSYSSDWSAIWSRALSRVKIDGEAGLVYSWISREDFQNCGASPDLTKIASFISAVFPANCALFLSEQKPGEIKGSLRSEPFGGKNVASLAKILGGGGHPHAAGFKQNGTIEEVLKKVLKLIR